MQDRANVSADFLDMMKQEIVDVIKKYIDVDETDMDVKLENRVNNDGTSGAPALYANIPIVGINEEKKKESEEIRKAKDSEEDEDVEVKPKKTARKKAVSVKKTATKTSKTSKTTKKATTKRTKKSNGDETATMESSDGKDATKDITKKIEKVADNTESDANQKNTATEE